MISKEQMDVNVRQNIEEYGEKECRELVRRSRIIITDYRNKDNVSKDTETLIDDMEFYCDVMTEHLDKLEQSK